MSEEEVLASGKGGNSATQFRVHLVKAPNVVKLESVKNAGLYLEATSEQGVYVGKGGPNSHLSLFKWT